MLHLIKLCVGVESLEELARWQKKRLQDKKKKGQKAELVHVTRQTPKRAAELLDGGSLYWVIKARSRRARRCVNFGPWCATAYPIAAWSMTKSWCR